MSQTIIEVFGTASQSVVKVLKPDIEMAHLGLMEYLQKNNIPIASSCMGEGICKKCNVIVQDSHKEREFLSCLLTLNKIFKSYQSPVRIKISYL